MTLYIYGCLSCGVNAAHVRRVKRRSVEDGFDLEVKNTKYDEQARAEHVDYLINNQLNSDTYPPIVVDGDTVTLLREWK